MVCDVHVGVEVALGKMETKLNSIEKNQDILLTEFRAYIENQKAEVDKKVSKYTFTTIVLIFSAIIGYVAIEVKDLKAEFNTLAKYVVSK